MDLHRKPKLNKITVPTLILLTLLAFISTSVLAATQQATTPKEKADALLSLLKNANSTVTDVFQQLEVENIEVPQTSLNEYNQAVALAEEAANLYEAGNYLEASGKIVQALQRLKETLRIIYENTNLKPSETDVTLERAASLNSSINRCQDQLQQIEQLVQVAATAGLNTSSLETAIATAKSLLFNASSELEQRNFEAATNNVTEAKNLIERMTLMLNDWAVELKTPRLESYINQTETRLTALRAEATSVSNSASLTALNQAETSLNLAKDYLEKQLFNQTVTELVNAKESEEQAVNALKPAASSGSTNSTSPTNTGPSAVRKP
jgi:hypothetical protein